MRIFPPDVLTQSVNDHGDNALKNGETKGNCSTGLKIHVIKLFSETKFKWILCLIVYNSVIVYELSCWATSTNSLALRAYANTIIFNVFALVVCLVSEWVSQNVPNCISEKIAAVKKPPYYNHSRSFSASGYPQYKKNFASHFPRHSISDPCLPQDVEIHQVVPQVASLSILGLEKYEVLALLVSSCLALAAASFVAVEAVTRIKDQPTIHTGRLGLGSLLGVVTHVITVYTHRDAALDHVVCRALPCPTLRDYNPILGGNVLGAAILCGTHLLIHYCETHVADTAAAFALVGLVATSMLPLAFYTASIILQKLPHYMGEQLDKCLREALNIDGVLEFRNERFWTQSFGKLAGTVQVRIRKDANESHVLERVMAGLSQIVTTLTVQEFRETPRANFGSEHCTEYYINELLPNAGKNKAPRMPRTDIDDVETVSIDDILGVENKPVGTFSSKQIIESNGKNTRHFNNNNNNSNNNTHQQKPVTIYNNRNIDTKNYLCNPQRAFNENALLVGSNVSEDRFAKCTIRMT